jgi:hypothetical protein
VFRGNRGPFVRHSCRKDYPRVHSG